MEPKPAYPEPGPHSPHTASSLWSPAEEGGLPKQAIPAGGRGGCLVRRGKDTVQVVIQQLLMHNAWATGRRGEKGHMSVRLSALRAPEAPGCRPATGVRRAVLLGAPLHGGWWGGAGWQAQGVQPHPRITGPAALLPLSLPSLSLNIRSLLPCLPALTCDPGFLSV